MFDARSIIDILIGGGPRGRGRPTDPSVFKDMLDQLGEQDTPTAADGPPTSGVEPQPPPGRHWTEQRYPQGSKGPQGAPTQPGTGPEIGKELQDLLRQVLEGKLGSIGQAPPRTQVSRVAGEGAASEPKSELGGVVELADAFKQILGQATAGAREGASRIDEATGLSAKAGEALQHATGQNPEELVAKLRQLIAENQLTAGAALGGLGALVLGTRAGRSLAAAAIKLGGLALIGGLAYKAYQNYQEGKPTLAAERETGAKPQTLVPAPSGSGFEAGVVTQDAARRYIRAMIAAAAADGRIDREEQERIVGGLRQSGLDAPAQQFLAAELKSPANVAELASGVASPEEALQVYTAARIAVDPDAAEENAFLSALAGALRIDKGLAAQVDAAARDAAG